MLEQRLFGDDWDVEVRPARAEWAARIRSRWQSSIEAILDVGQLLVSSKVRLEHGEWEAMVEEDLPFGPRSARMLMAIANDERLRNRGSVLPPSWRTMYELTRLDDEQLEQLDINPEMERSAVTALVKKERRAERERDLGDKIRALPERKYGVIYADPPWKFAPWGEGGMDRSAGNHYPEQDYNDIGALKVGKLAHDDCVLFLWATAPMLEVALAVMQAWGFSYRSQFVWWKDKIGTGYWNRNEHELLLVGVRGAPPAPSPGSQWPSVISAPRGEHSVKPDRFYELIEAYFPNVPKIELYARNARNGWDAWGNEVP